MTKIEFIRRFLPETVDDIKLTKINLDIDDLGIADILRNLNQTYPVGSRNRNAIQSGRLAIAIRCTSELLSPLYGMVLIITNDETDEIDIVSKNFAVAVINEANITTDDEIQETLNNFSNYLIHEYKEEIPEFKSFYIKYVYDLYELEEEEELLRKEYNV